MPLDPSLLQRIRENDMTLDDIIFTNMATNDTILEMCTALLNSSLVLQITLNNCSIDFNGMKALLESKGVSSININDCHIDDRSRRYLTDQFYDIRIRLLKSDGNNINLEGNILPSKYAIHKIAAQTRTYHADNQSSSSSSHIQANTSTSREHRPRLAPTYDRNWAYRQRAAEELERLQRELESLRGINPWLVLRALYDRYQIHSPFGTEQRRQRSTVPTFPIDRDRSLELDLVQRDDPSLKILSLTSVDARHMQAFCTALQNNTELTDLSIEGIALTEVQLKMLAQHRPFQILRLIGCQLGNDSATFLAEHCAASTLDLSANAISSTGAIAFAGNMHITTLSLAHNAICDKGAGVLAQSKKIRSLDLSWNLITARGAELLSVNMLLISLNLADNRVKDKGAKFLSNSTSITSLNLSNNDLSDECTAMLGGNNILTVLVLDRNHIGPRGAMLLSKSKSLAKLSLDQNVLGDEGASFLAVGYQGYWLSIGLNGITNAGAIQLATSKTITTLLVEGNLIGNDGAILLVGNTRLTTLGLSGNRIGRKTLKALGKNGTLTSVNMDDDLSLGEPDYSLWLALIASQDPRMLHLWWSLNHMFNSINNEYLNAAKEKIRANQENARELVLVFRDDTLSQVQKFGKIRALLGNIVSSLLPYGQYIEGELGYGETLLHIAVRDENIPLIILLKTHMPASVSKQRDVFNMTYEDLALLLGLELPAEARLTQTEQTTHSTITTQLESNIIDQDPRLRQYYKELKENLITLKIASHLIMKSGLMYNSSTTAQGLSAATGVMSATVASIIAWLGKQVEVRKRNSLAEWLDEKETVITLARRLTYARKADILHSSVEGLGFLDRAGIFIKKLKYGREYTVPQALACIDTEKLASHIRDNKKPERQTAAGSVDDLLKVIMGASFEYQAPTSIPGIDKGKTPVHHVVPQHIIAPPTLVVRQETTDVLVQELDALRNKYIELEKTHEQLKISYDEILKKLVSTDKIHQKALEEKETEMSAVKEELKITTSKYQTTLDLLNKYRMRDNEQKNTANQSSGSSSSTIQDGAMNKSKENVAPTATTATDSTPIFTIFFSFDNHRIVNNAQHPQALPLTRNIREQRRHKNSTSTLSGGFT